MCNSTSFCRERILPKRILKNKIFINFLERKVIRSLTLLWRINLLIGIHGIKKQIIKTNKLSILTGVNVFKRQKAKTNKILNSNPKDSNN